MAMILDRSFLVFLLDLYGFSKNPTSIFNLFIDCTVLMEPYPTRLAIRGVIVELSWIESNHDD